MLKLVFTVAVLVVIYFIFFKKKKPKVGKNEQSTEDMVECSKCGVYTSIEEAYISSGKYYCSKECLRLK